MSRSDNREGDVDAGADEGEENAGDGLCPGAEDLAGEGEGVLENWAESQRLHI